MKLHDQLLARAERHPEAELATSGDERLTYGQGATRVRVLAAAMRANGLRPGDRVAYLSKNTIDFALFYFAASLAEVVPVPLNYRLAPPEWAYILGDAGARAVVAQPEFASGIDAIGSDVPSLRHRVIDGEGRPGWSPLRAWTGRPPGDVSAGLGAPRPDATTHPAYQMYTSGTTGRPKGVIMSQEALAVVLAQWRITYPAPLHERSLIVAPMYHVAGSLFTFHTVASGGSVLVLPDFDASEVTRVLDEDEIGFAFLVPAMIQACLQSPGAADRSYEHLRSIGYGASPIAESVLRQAMDTFGCEFSQAYGMTEVPNLTMLTEADHRRALDGRPDLLQSAGRAGPATTVVVVDDDDQSVPPGAVGEVCGTGGQVMDGYWNLPDATADALRHGLMHTGDAGYLDDEGYLFLKDRIKDMIVSGAENIYPREVEDVLFGHPAIADVAVVGVPSERWGETVKAVVVCVPGQTVSLDDLVDFCDGRIARYKQPRVLDLVDELPRNPSGKVLKRLLRERSAPAPD